MATLPAELRDPWVAGGLVLLVALTGLTAALYRGQPQSAAEVRTGAALVARPDAFGPRRDRAATLLDAAARDTVAGRDSVAETTFVEAAAQAARAAESAGSEAQTAEAAALWGRAMLGRAEVLRRRGTGTGIRPDDNDVLRRALAVTDSAAAAPLPPNVAAEAAALRERLARQLRPGPLEWLPVRP